MLNSVVSFPLALTNPEYPTVPHNLLSSPYLKLEGPACVSEMPQPDKMVSFIFALSSPSVSFKNKK